MQSKYRLKKKYQYKYVYNHASSVADGNFVMLYCAGSKQTKVGFSVGKKYGHAVRRNRIRRQMKAAVSQIMPDVKNGYSVIFIPRKSVDYDFSDVTESVRVLFSKAGLLK